MITPAYSPTATERVLPRLALDFTTGVLDPRVTVTRALNTATAVNSSGYIAGVNANLPRFDYDPVTLAPRGLLIEETRSNIVFPSGDLSSWTPANVTFSNASVTAPDGANTVTKIEENNVNGIHAIVQQLSGISAGSVHTISIYAKKAERSWIVLSDSASTTAKAFFNLNDGTVGTVSGTGSPSATISNAGDGYYRCTLTFTVGAGGNPRCRYDIALSNGVDSYQGVTGSGLYIFGAQMEAGAFATSYIPTTTTSLTRNADAVSMTGTNFSDWYNQSEGTFVAQAITQRPTTAGSPPRVFTAHDGSENNRVTIDFVSTNVRGIVTVTNVNQFLATIAYTPNTTTKFGLAYRLNSFAFARNGDAPATSTSGTVPSALTALQIGATSASANFLSGHIQTLYYWPQRLLNAETQAFSKQG